MRDESVAESVASPSQNLRRTTRNAYRGPSHARVDLPPSQMRRTQAAVQTPVAVRRTGMFSILGCVLSRAQNTKNPARWCGADRSYTNNHARGLWADMGVKA